jgi:hypothetical protein
MRIARPVLLALLLAITACGGSARRDLLLLIDDRCPESAAFKNNLDDMLAAMALDPSQSYALVNLATLPATDPRARYRAPTLLFHDAQMFRATEDVETFPMLSATLTPTCRLYPGGVPTARKISGELTRVLEPSRRRREIAQRLAGSVADYVSVIRDVGVRLAGGSRRERFVY